MATENYQNFDRIVRKASVSGDDKPDQMTWIKLERKLDKKSYKKNLIRYKNISIAAIFIFLLSCILMVSLFLNHEKDTISEELSQETTGEYFPEDYNDSSTELNEFYASVLELNDYYVRMNVDAID